MAGMEGFLGDRKAEMEGFLGGRGDRNRGEFDPRHRGDWKNPTPQYIEGDPRRPAAGGGRRGKVGYQQESPEHNGETEKYAGFGIGITGLIAENIICHPFMILRRQCQVHVESARYHTTPFTLLPVMLHLNRWQGSSALFKGVGSSLTIKGMGLGIEDCVSKFSPWPKEINKHSSLKMIGQHLLLKGTSAAILTPFYSASLVETVQSDIASEKPGVLDVFREGIVRLVSWSDPRCGRMLPVWVLIPPQVAHNLFHYVIKTIVERVWLQVMKASHREFQRLKGAVSRDPELSLPGLTQYQNQAAGLAGHLVADVMLFPLETVLHRLHLQGTRSIIDNLDSGKEVIPILTRYEGVTDCFSTILREEGVKGLFKGFGALVLQYSLHFLIIKFSSKIISKIAQVLSTQGLSFDGPSQQPPVKEADLGHMTSSMGLGTLSPGASPVLAPSSAPQSKGVSSLPPVRETIPEHPEIYSSSPSLRDYSGSVNTSPRRHLDVDISAGRSGKNWRSMENL